MSAVALGVRETTNAGAGHGVAVRLVSRRAVGVDRAGGVTGVVLREARLAGAAVCGHEARLAPSEHAEGRTRRAVGVAQAVDATEVRAAAELALVPADRAAAATT